MADDQEQLTLVVEVDDRASAKIANLEIAIGRARRCGVGACLARRQRVEGRDQSGKARGAS